MAINQRIDGISSTTIVSPSNPAAYISQTFANSNSEAAVRTKLHAIRTQQNEADAAQDASDLRKLISEALLEGSDAGMMRVLQVGREEMPEAIKALQRALEMEVREEDEELTVVETRARPRAIVAEEEDNGRRGSAPALGLLQRAASITQRRKTVATINVTESSRNNTNSSSNTGSSGVDTPPRDTLDREFMEGGIDALRRLSRGGVSVLPSWTITR